MAAGKLTVDNSTALAACREAAAKTKKEQRLHPRCAGTVRLVRRAREESGLTSWMSFRWFGSGLERQRRPGDPPVGGSRIKRPELHDEVPRHQQRT